MHARPPLSSPPPFSPPTCPGSSAPAPPPFNMGGATLRAFFTFVLARFSRAFLLAFFTCFFHVLPPRPRWSVSFLSQPFSPPFPLPSVSRFATVFEELFACSISQLPQGSRKHGTTSKKRNKNKQQKVPASTLPLFRTSTTTTTMSSSSSGDDNSCGAEAAPPSPQSAKVPKKAKRSTATKAAQWKTVSPAKLEPTTSEVANRMLPAAGVTCADPIPKAKLFENFTLSKEAKKAEKNRPQTKGWSFHACF